MSMRDFTSRTRRMPSGGSRYGSPVFGWRDKCRVLSDALPSSMTRLKNVPELKSCRDLAQMMRP